MIHPDIYRSNKSANDTGDSSNKAARIHKYQNPLTIEKIAKPTITSGQQVLVKVGASGLCHSDLHLINGEWKDVLPIPLPITHSLGEVKKGIDTTEYEWIRELPIFSKKEGMTITYRYGG